MDNAILEQVLNTKIRPALRLHHGDICFESYCDGLLRLRLLGECARCAFAQGETKNNIEQVLFAAFPQLKQVQIQTGVSDSLLTEARQILAQRKEMKTPDESIYERKR